MSRTSQGVRKTAEGLTTVTLPTIHESLAPVRFSWAAADNERSARVLKKLGFAEEGLQQKHFCKWGKWNEVRLLGLLRKEWRC